MATVTGANGHDLAATREYQEQARRGALFGQLADHGLSRWGGEVVDEFLYQLQGNSGRKIYREMADNCPVVGALLQAIEMAVRAVSWRVEPGSEARTDKLAADFVDECLKDMSFTWEDTIAEFFSALVYGWAYGEIVYKRRGGMNASPQAHSRYTDGKIGWRKFIVISQETLDRWHFDDDGGIKGLYQRAPMDIQTRYIPIDKAVLYRTTTKRNNPEGMSILRRAYTTWYYRKHILEVMGIGIERDLTGLPVIIAPENMDLTSTDAQTVATVTALKQIVRDLKVDEQGGVILPFGYDFKLLASPGSRQHNIVEVLNYLDQRIALTTLAQFLLLGMDKVGSFALSQSQSDLFTLSMTGWVRGYAEDFNRFAIPRLLLLNGMDVKVLPRLAHGVIGEPNIAEFSEAVNKLSGVGILNPTEGDENAVRKLLHLPEMPEPGKEEPPRVSVSRDRLVRQRGSLLSEEQTLRELGYSDELIARILQEKRAGKLQDSNIGAGLLQAFERGYLGGGDRDQ